MKIKASLLSVAAGLAISTAVGAPAWALQTNFIVTGTIGIDEGYDTAGVFGSPDTDLSGDPFVADFQIDTAQGYFESPGTYQAVVGGTEQGVSSPVSATLTINGVTQSFGENASYANAIVGDPGGGSDTVGTYTSTYDGSGKFIGAIEAGISSPSHDPSYPTVFGQAFSVLANATNGDSGSGYFELVDPATGTPTAYGDLNVSEITDVSAAPEPSTWALLMLGIGGIGLMFRRAGKTPGFRWRDCLPA